MPVSPPPQGCETACRACRHRHLSAAASLAQKRDWLARRLGRWADRLAPVESVPNGERWGYRDRVTLHAAWNGDLWDFGLLVDRELLPIPDCPLHSPRVGATVHLLRERLPSPDDFSLVYLVQAGAQAVLVLKQHEMPPMAWLNEDAKAALKCLGIEGLWLHLHPSAGRKVLAKPGWHLVWGVPRSRDSEGRVYGPAAFQQLLPTLHERSLDRAEAFLAPAAGDRVIDLYCGAGTSLQRWRARGAETAGVEAGGEALACAAINAPGGLLLRGNCDARLPQLTAWTRDRGGTPLLYANPPRTGMEAAVTRWIVDEYQPQRIAYLSCSAGTLARDLEIMTNGGYEVVELVPYDFFPQTHHVETLALLERQC